MRVGIVGGGASGLLTAAAFLRAAREPISVTVFEPRAELGQGVAYSTDDDLHLLNVPACGMSALPDDPTHFARWAGCEPTAFVSRRDYARYLADVLDEARRASAAGVSLEHVRERAIALGTQPRLWIRTDTAAVSTFDAIVLATGNGQPVVPEPLRDAALGSDRLIADPWAADAFELVRANDEVLVVGTGLTFVDVSMSLIARIPGVRVRGVSHHGLVPQAHDDPWHPADPAPEWVPGDVDLRTVLRYLRGFGADWRRGVDSLRPLTSRLWRAASDADRARIATRLGRFWDVHRHRMAPPVARTFASLVDLGRVRVDAATIAYASAVDDGIDVRFCDGSVARVDRIVVCTGPCGDPSANPLGRHLIGSGLAAPGPLHAGFLVAPDSGALLTESGPSGAIFAIGSLRRGVLWESTAIPEIRGQAVALATAVLQHSAAAA